MKLETFFEKFDTFAEATDSLAKIRELVLELAVQGKLSDHRASDAEDPVWTKLLQQLDAEQVAAASYIEPPFEIPDWWRWTTLASLGDTKPRNNEPESATSSFVPMTLIPVEYGLSIRHEERPWGEIKKGYTHFRNGDVVMAKITPCFENGKSAVVNELTGGFGAGTTELHVFRRSSNGVLPEFVLLYLKTRGFITRGIPKMTGSAGQKRVPSDYFARSPFPLPPLAEQKRIVAKVDELMALCDRLEAQLKERETRQAELARAALARFAAAPTLANLELLFYPPPCPRASVRKTSDVSHKGTEAQSPSSFLVQPSDLRKTILTLAVQGKLVPQDPNDEPAVATTTSRVAKPQSELRGPFELPNNWKWRQLGQVSELINGDRSKNYPNKAEYVQEGVAWINTGHIEPDGTLSLGSMHYITRKKFDSLRSGKVHPGDLVYCLRGATLGKTAIITQFKEGAVASSLVIIRLSPAIEPRFAYRVLTSPLGREQIFKFDNGSAQPNLSANNVKKYWIPLPPLAEQRRIVAKVDQLMALVEKLEAQLAASRATADKLMAAAVAELTASCHTP